MRKLYLLVVASWFCTLSFSQSRKMAAVGSSTTAGTGAFPSDSSWVRRFSYYYKNQSGILDSAYNLGVGGYPVYKGMPSTYVPPPGRDGPDPSKNVSKAVSLLSDVAIPSNGVIIINYPTNGYDVYSIAEIMNCLQIMYDSAVMGGNKCYITTTQPRTDGSFNTSAMKKKLADIKDSILNRFGTINTINFWDGMFNPADTTILAAYSAGDNIHFNNTGHRILFERVVAKNVFAVALPFTIHRLEGVLKNKQAHLQFTVACDDPNSYFTVQRSRDGARFEPLQQIPVKKGNGGQQYEYIDAYPLPGNNFYRLQVTEQGRHYFSRIISIKNEVQSIVLKKLYPIPATETITLEIVALQKQPITIDIVNSSGVRLQQYIRRIDREDMMITLPVSSLPLGAYFVRIYYKDRDPIIQSFTK
jgi:hypothetical protein